MKKNYFFFLAKLAAAIYCVLFFPQNELDKTKWP
jgi:hypothetical protein